MAAGSRRMSESAVEMPSVTSKLRPVISGS